MRKNYSLTLAKQNLAKRIGVTEQNLEFAFIWEYESNIYFSFQINQLGHAQHGSTLSIQIESAEAQLD